MLLDMWAAQSHPMASGTYTMHCAFQASAYARQLSHFARIEQMVLSCLVASHTICHIYLSSQAVKACGWCKPYTATLATLGDSVPGIHIQRYSRHPTLEKGIGQQ